MNYRKAVSLAKKGRNEGYDFLYKETYQKVYYVALKYMNNHDSAIDVVQDAYIKAFNSLSQLEDPDKFQSWLSTIVATRSLNEIRKKTPVTFSQLENDDEDYRIEDMYEDTNISNQPELAYEKEETSRMISEIINDLSDEQRLCVLMFYMEQKSVKEISSIMSVSENTVKSRLNYGRKKIKVKVEELEKSGVKLYGMAPIPFLLWLMKTECYAGQANIATECSAVLDVVKNNLSEAGITDTAVEAAKESVSEAANTGVSEATGTGIGSAAKAVTRKVTALRIAAGLSVAAVGAGAGAVAYNAHIKNVPAENNTRKEKVETVNSDKPAIEVHDTVDYNKIYEEYINKEVIVKGKEYPLYLDVVDEYEAEIDADTVEEGVFSYNIYDYNNDGKDELLTLRESESGDKVVIEMYKCEDDIDKNVDSVDNDKITMMSETECESFDMSASDMKWKCYISEGGRIIIESYAKYSNYFDGAYYSFTSYIVKDNNIVKECYATYDGDAGDEEDSPFETEGIESLNIDIPQSDWNNIKRGHKRLEEYLEVKEQIAQVVIRPVLSENEWENTYGNSSISGKKIEYSHIVFR